MADPDDIDTLIAADDDPRIIGPHDPLGSECSDGFVCADCGRWCSNGVTHDGFATHIPATGSEREAGLDVERLAEVVSDSLAATTMGTDWAEAPTPSDEPGSPYVMRLTNEILSRLRSAAPTGATPNAEPPLDVERMAVADLVAAVETVLKQRGYIDIDGSFLGETEQLDADLFAALGETT